MLIDIGITNTKNYKLSKEVKQGTSFYVARKVSSENNEVLWWKIVQWIPGKQFEYNNQPQPIYYFTNVMNHKIIFSFIVVIKMNQNDFISKSCGCNGNWNNQLHNSAHSILI